MLHRSIELAPVIYSVDPNVIEVKQQKSNHSTTFVTAVADVCIVHVHVYSSSCNQHVSFWGHDCH